MTPLPLSRFVQNAVGPALFAGGIYPNDVVYVTLPLYHSSGCYIATGQMLFNGCTIVLKKSFSASSFWPDCIQHKCTVRLS